MKKQLIILGLLLATTSFGQQLGMSIQEFKKVIPYAEFESGKDNLQASYKEDSTDYLIIFDDNLNISSISTSRPFVTKGEVEDYKHSDEFKKLFTYRGNGYYYFNDAIIPTLFFIEHAEDVGMFTVMMHEKK